MYLIKKQGYLFLAFLVTLSACDVIESDAEAEEVSVELGTMQAHVNGQGLEPIRANAGYFPPQAPGEAIQMAGAGLGWAVLLVVADHDEIKARTYEVLEEGQLQLGVSRGSQAFYIDGSGKYAATGGHITITRIKEGRIEGRFAFHAENPDTGDTISLTDGQFNLLLQEAETTAPPALRP